VTASRKWCCQLKGETFAPQIKEICAEYWIEKNAVLASFLSLQKPKKAMKEEAANADTYNYNKILYDKIQLLTVEDILVGKKDFIHQLRSGFEIRQGKPIPP
jgi:hypothetical protein